jgi:type IX secretion system PorP/SprF family membrane protein
MLRVVILSIILSVFALASLRAQDLPVHEQYMFDYMLVNPAFAGLSEVTSVKMVHRQQWIGIDDAPHTSTLMFKRRLKGREGGFGGYLFSDINGPDKKYGAQITWSFQALLKSVRYNKTMLSFGLSFKGLVHVLDETQLDRDIYDPIISYSQRVTFVPNANAGLIFSHRQSFIGAAFENLIPWTDRMYNLAIEPVNYVIMNIHGGTILQIKRRVQIRPSAMVRTNFHGLSQLDVNFKVHLFGGESLKSVYIRFPNEAWFGFSYSNSLDYGNSAPLSFSPIFGFSVKAFTLYYQYDLGLTSLQLYNSGSHQIGIGFRLFPDKYVNWDKHHIPLFTEDF